MRLDDTAIMASGVKWVKFPLVDYSLELELIHLNCQDSCNASQTICMVRYGDLILYSPEVGDTKCYCPPSISYSDLNKSDILAWD